MRNRRRRIVSRTDSEEKSSRKSLVFFPSHIPHYAQMLFKKAKDARSPTPQTNPINAATQRKLPHFGDPTKREKKANMQYNPASQNVLQDPEKPKQAQWFCQRRRRRCPLPSYHSCPCVREPQIHRWNASSTSTSQKLPSRKRNSSVVIVAARDWSATD